MRPELDRSQTAHPHHRLNPAPNSHGPRSHRPGSIHSSFYAEQECGRHRELNGEAREAELAAHIARRRTSKCFHSSECRRHHSLLRTANIEPGEVLPLPRTIEYSVSMRQA